MVLALSMSFRWSILTFRKLKKEEVQFIIHLSWFFYATWQQILCDCLLQKKYIKYDKDIIPIHTKFF